MFLSKQHYAVELAKRGNAVYFINPPEQASNKKVKSIDIVPSGIQNLWLINHRLAFPYRLKFHAIGFFHFLMRFHITKMVKAIKKPINIIWSFDIGNIYPFDCFDKNAIKIFHPVDEPLNKVAFDSAKGCDIIFSVTNEILEKYENIQVPKHFINHGVSQDFFKPTIGITANKQIHIGFSGNLMRTDIDRDTLLKIIAQHPGIIFDLFGPYTDTQSNIGGVVDEATGHFISVLKSFPNVKLYGSLATKELAKKLFQMDAFLICYDINKDQSKGTNYHKIMEYLSIGKVIISNNVTTYAKKPELISMTTNRTNNNELPALFKLVIGHLPEYNKIELQEKRKSFAKENTYEKQIERINRILLEFDKN